jgi:hypothetical protein
MGHHHILRFPFVGGLITVFFIGGLGVKKKKIIASATPRSLISYSGFWAK